MTATTIQSSMPIRPMNDDPFVYPTAPFASLSEDARFVYRYALRNRTSRIDRDIFDKKQRNAYLGHNAPKFDPTERMSAAFAELQRTGLGSYDAEYGWLRVQQVRDDYTVAHGRGAHFMTVSTFTDHLDYAVRLATLIGADFESTNPRPGVKELTLRARHVDATDFEHDASSTALLTIRNISEPEHMGYGHQRYIGVLAEARLYPIGVDPTQVEDDDTRPGRCDTCEDRHPFAPYQPPVVATLQVPTFVVVETFPYRPYLVAGAAVTPHPESENA